MVLPELKILNCLRDFWMVHANFLFETTFISPIKHFSCMIENS